MTFIVICYGDKEPGQKKGRYELATRTVFKDEVIAKAWAKSINPSRKPKVIPGDWADLRFDQDTRFNARFLARFLQM
jgi:hypothetical protein